VGAERALRYPGKVAIRHVVEAAKACGIDVAGIEVSPDGSIRAIDARLAPSRPLDEFERLEAEGKL
jgi:hypothetical protein